ncbi:MAG: TlpA family protein disulfide reductase [Deltaproteobacteria bacterium]|nr:TlpA family protein disulfide reductase [Deltaproteobacteria bacterium]
MPQAALPLATRWIAAASAVVGSCVASLPASEQHPLLGQVPPLEERPSIDGGFITLPARGHVTVMDFWATYCKPCLALMPQYEAIWRERRDDGLVVIGVAADDNPGLVATRLKMLGISYPNVLDDGEPSLRGTYGVLDLPRALVFDRTGRLRLVLTGGRAEEAGKVREGVAALLEE